MNELLRYLNIYAHNFVGCNLDFMYDGQRIRVQGDELGPYVAESIIINKKFGFIKRLVDNDKIDHKIYEDMKFTAIKQGVLIDKKSGSTAQETREIIKNGCIDIFIALLAISDTPIQDLCVWLK